MRKLGLLVACLGACALDGETDEVLGETDQDIEIGSNDVNSPLRNAVVWVGTGCTGTLIAPDVVLTAAHCGWSEERWATGDWISIPDVQIRFGYDARVNTTSPLGTATAYQVSVPLLASEGPWRVDDIALLKLRAPVPATLATPRPAYVDRPVTLSSASTIYQVGYGGYNEDGTRRNRRFAAGSGYRDWSTSSELLMNAFAYTQWNRGAGIGDRDTNVEHGDSGGPMLLGHLGGYVLGELSWWDPYGIATFGPGGNGRPSIRSWLQAKAPQKPDFDVVSIIASGCTGSGGDPTIRVTVKNRGARTSWAWVDVFVDRAEAPPIGTFSTIYRSSGNLAPEQTLDMYFALPGATPGSHRVDALMDTTRSQDEIDENNNTGYAWVDLPDCSFN